MLGITLLAIGRTGDPEDVMTVDAIVYSREDIALYDDIEAATDTGHDLGARERSHGRKAADGRRRRLRHPPARDRGRRERRRPKTEEYAEHTFTLLRTADLTRGEATFEEEIETVPVGIFIGLDWVASMSPGSDEPVDRVWRAVANHDERLLERGPDFTAYRIMDVIVDEYFTVLDRIETSIERIEETSSTRRRSRRSKRSTVPAAICSPSGRSPGLPGRRCRYSQGAIRYR